MLPVVKNFCCCFLNNFFTVNFLSTIVDYWLYCTEFLLNISVLLLFEQLFELKLMEWNLLICICYLMEREKLPIWLRNNILEKLRREWECLYDMLHIFAIRQLFNCIFLLYIIIEDVNKFLFYYENQKMRATCVCPMDTVGLWIFFLTKCLWSFEGYSVDILQTEDGFFLCLSNEHGCFKENLKSQCSQGRNEMKIVCHWLQTI